MKIQIIAFIAAGAVRLQAGWQIFRRERMFPLNGGGFLPKGWGQTTGFARFCGKTAARGSVFAPFTDGAQTPAGCFLWKNAATS